MSEKEFLCDDIADMEKLLDDSADQYYQTGEGTIPDDAYDQLSAAAERTKIGFTSEMNEEELPLHMGSLKYTKDNKHKFFLNKLHQTATDKLDGIAIELEFTAGILTGAWKRGDHDHGMNVTDHMRVCRCPTELKLEPDVPNRARLLYILGADIFEAGVKSYAKCEAVIPKAVFKRKWSKDVLGKDKGFASPRSFVAGMMAKKKLAAGLKDIDIVCHDFVDVDDNIFGDYWTHSITAFESVSKGKIVWFQCGSPDPAIVFERRKEKSIYDLDGLVYKLEHTKDRRASEWVSGCPGYAMAFKGPDESAVTTVTDITHDVGRTGVLNPVIWYEPVMLLGTECRKATGHNQTYLEDHYLGPGAVIVISKHGTVIPNHDNTVQQAPTTSIIKMCPGCGSVVVREGDEFYCMNAMGWIVGENSPCKWTAIRRLDYCYKKLGLEDAGESTWELWYDAFGEEFDPQWLMIAPFSTLLSGWEKAGVGKKTATSLITQLNDVRMRVLPLHIFVTALGFPGLGEDTTYRVLKALPDLFHRQYITPDIENRLKAIKQVGPETVETLKKYFFQVKNIITVFEERLQIEEWGSATGTSIQSNKLEGVVYYFTGFRDTELKHFIERHSGVIRKGFSKREVTCVVRADIGYMSNKVKDAEASGTELIIHATLVERMVKIGYEV